MQLRVLVPCLLTIVLATPLRADMLDDCLSLEDSAQVIAACSAVIDLAAATDDELAQAHNKRGLGLFRLGREGLALQDFDAAIRLKRSLAGAYVNRGATQLRLGRRLHAIFDFNAALAHDPDNAAAYFLRGTAYLDDGVPHQAVDDLSAALRLYPGYPRAYIHRADAYLQLGRTDDAIRDYDKALELDPGQAPVHRQRGNAHRAARRYDQALKDYDRAIAIDPEFVSTYNSRGLLLAQRGRFSQAIQDYSHAIRLDPKFYYPYRNRGLAYAWLNRLDAAKRDLDTALSLTTARELADWYINVCHDLGVMGQADLALPYCRKGVALLPAAVAHDQLAFVLWLGGDRAAARRELSMGNLAVPDAQRIDLDQHMDRYPLRLTQGLLRGFGYLSGRVTGTLDTETEQAIRHFQENRALPVDGRVSDDLVAALLSARSSQAAKYAATN